MRTQSIDTSPEAERVQIELIRKAPISKRFALLQAWSQFLIGINKQGIRKRHPQASEEEVRLIFVANNYGQALADRLREVLAKGEKAVKESNIELVVTAMTPIIEALEDLGINYHIGGSVASSFYGSISASSSLDIVADLKLEHVQPLVKRLEPDYYIDADAVRDAIRRRASFNAIHFGTMLKVDIFIPKARLFDQEEFRRMRKETLVEGARPFYMASPEDTILHKLEWYKMGGEVSDRQWNDVLGVLKVQGANLDVAYLQRWAIVLDVADLLQQALEDAGL